MNPNNLILSPPGTIVDVLACLFFPPGAAAAGRCAAGLAKLKVLYLSSPRAQPLVVGPPPARRGDKNN